MAQATNYNKYKKYTKNKYKSKPLKNRASMLAMWTSTNIKKHQTYPNDSFAHRRWNLPFFCPCQISGFCFCHGRSFCQSVVFGCLLLFHFSGLIKIDCKQHIPLLFSLWPGCPVLWWRVPLKNKVLPPDTVGFVGSSRDNWCYAWGSWGFPGDVWIWELDWVRAGVLIL